MRRHHHHPVRQIHRLGDIVRHVDHGLAGFPPHVGEQPLHVVAGQRVERRERLVHQQHRGIVGERARDGDPLLHAAREMVRIGVGEFFELDQLELLLRDFLALGLAHALHLQAEGDVAQRGAPGKQLGEILEHHAAVLAVALHRLAADRDHAAGRLQEAGDDVEQRGFAAAGRPDDAEEFGLLDVEACALDAGDLAGRGVIDQRHVADFNMGHFVPWFVPWRLVGFLFLQPLCPFLHGSRPAFGVAGANFGVACRRAGRMGRNAIQGAVRWDLKPHKPRRSPAR